MEHLRAIPIRVRGESIRAIPTKIADLTTKGVIAYNDPRADPGADAGPMTTSLGNQINDTAINDTNGFFDAPDSVVSSAFNDTNQINDTAILGSRWHSRCRCRCRVQHATSLAYCIHARFAYTQGLKLLNRQLSGMKMRGHLSLHGRLGKKFVN